MGIYGLAGESCDKGSTPELSRSNSGRESLASRPDHFEESRLSRFLQGHFLYLGRLRVAASSRPCWTWFISRTRLEVLCELIYTTTWEGERHNNLFCARGWKNKELVELVDKAWKVQNTWSLSLWIKNPYCDLKTFVWFESWIITIRHLREEEQS